MFVPHDPAGATTVAPVAASGGHVRVPSEEVARQRIAPYSGLRPAEERQMPNPQFGSAFVPPVAPNNMDNESSAHFTRIHAIIGASLLGSALLLVLSCALFQYCKKTRRQRSQDQGSSSTATSRWESTQATRDEAAAARREDADANLELSLSLPLPPQQSPPSLYDDDCAEDDVDDVPNQQTPLRGAGRDKTTINTSNRSGSENELSRLADSYCRDGTQPVRYCFVGNADGQVATALITLDSAVAVADIPATLTPSRGRPTEETSPALDTPAKAQPPSLTADLTLIPTTPSVLDNVSLSPTSTASGLLSLPGPPSHGRLLSTPAAAHLNRPELLLLTPESINTGKAKSVFGRSLTSGNEHAGPTPRAQSVKRKSSQLEWKVLNVRSPPPSSHQQGLQSAALWSSRIAGVHENDSCAAVSGSLSTSRTSVDTPTACTTFDQQQNEVVSAATLSIPQLHQESPMQLAVVAENDFCSLSPLKIISLVESRAYGANKRDGQMTTNTDPDKIDCCTSLNDQLTRRHVEILSTVKDCQDTSFGVTKSVRYSQESGQDHCDNSSCVAFCEHDIKDQQVGKSRVTTPRVVSVVSPASDHSSETSQFLATLTLELSPSDVIVDDVATLVRSVHLSSDRDSALSDESLTSLQDLRAQAEFSPYHLAWSTPYLSQRFDDEYPTGPSKLPAAKRLIMSEPEAASFADSASRRSSLRSVAPTTATAGIGTDHQQRSGQPDIESDESSSWLLLGSQMPPGVATSFSSLLQSWGAWKDPGKTSPGPSKEARATGAEAGTGTPRPLSFPLQSGSHAATSNDNTFPYTVAEYRKSLMNVSLSGRTEHWDDVHSASPSPYSSPSSAAYSSYIQGGTTAMTQLACCKVLFGPFASAAGCSDREETCNTVLASRDRAYNLTTDNTLADIQDFTDSSSGGHYGEATTGSSDPGYYCLGSRSKGSLGVSNYGVACQSALTSPTHSSPLLSKSASSKSYVTSPSELSHSDLSGVSLSPAALSDMSTRSGGTSTAPLTDHSDLASRNSILEKSAPLQQSSQLPFSSPANFPATNDNSLPVDNYPFSTAPAGAALNGSAPLSPTSGGSRNSTASSLMMPRSRSATAGSLSHYADHDTAAFWPQPSSPAPPCHLWRSRTSGEISPAQQHGLRLWEGPALYGRPLRPNPRFTSLMSVGSASDVSVSSTTAASRLSLLWDHECLASGRAFSESLTWEDDPCLEQVTEIIFI